MCNSVKSNTGNNQNKIFHGFCKEEIFLFYKFISIHDKYLKDIQKQQEIFELIPNIKIVYNKEYKGIVKQIRKADLKNFNECSDGKIYLTKNRKSLIMSFLCHLRNSIAHGHIVKKSNLISISDFIKTKDFRLQNCIGKIELEKVSKILDIILKVYEE